MTAKKRGLGKGLDALLGTSSDVNLASSSESSALKMLAIDLVREVNTNQDKILIKML